MTPNRKEPLSWADLGITVNLSGPTEQDALCPKCSPTRKKSKARCLGVNLSTGTWFCHHCGATGSQMTGWSDEKDWRPNLPTTPKDYKAPKPLPPTPPAPVDAEPATSPEEEAWDRWAQWFAERGISEVTLRRNKVTVTNQYMRDANEGEGDNLWVVAFPYYDGKEHVNTKYRGIDKDGERCLQMAGGARLIPYGINDITPDTDVGFIVEGEPDKLAMEEAGFTAVISVPNGAPSPDAKNYDSHFQWFHDYETRFSYRKDVDGKYHGVKEWVIAVDSDAAGRKLGTELARMLGPERCYRVDWSLAGEGIKDANDALKDWGKKDFRNKMARITRRWPVEGLFHVTTLEKNLDDWWENGPPQALSTGWELMDPAYKLITSSTTIVTGVPNIGKSTWLHALAVNMMVNHDWRFAICSPEWRPIEAQIIAMAEVLIGRPFSKWMPNRMTREQFEWAKQWINERVAFILPEHPTIPYILELVDIAIARLGVRGLIIDPWGEIETSYMKPNGINDSAWVGQCLRDVRRHTHIRDLWTAIAHHPTKLDKDANGEYPVVDLYDLSGSAKFGDIADFCVSLWRSSIWDDQEQTETEVWIKKSRFRHAGKRGMSVKLYFDETTGRFSDRPWTVGSAGKMPWEMEESAPANVVPLKGN